VNGWALGASGESEKGLTQIAQGVNGYGLGNSQHMLLALQADAQLATGKPEAALASVAAGLKAVEKMGGAPLEAELYRLRGEALLAGAGTVSEAETAIEQSIDVARRQRQLRRDEAQKSRANVRLPVVPAIRWRDHEGRFRVDSGGSRVVPRTAVDGASCPLPCVPAKVASLNRQRPFSLGGRNRSSCR
jgi:hypothetical protein